MVRRFPVVEKRWRAACQRENENLNDESVKSAAAADAPSLYLPTDSEIATAFTERKNRLTFIFMLKRNYSISSN